MTARDVTPLLRDPRLHVVFGVTLMVVLGVASVAPALPSVADELGISDAQVGLVITAFTLPGVVLTPVLGLAADRYGRKRVLVPSLVLFGVAGTAVAIAPSFTWLVGLRFLQGVGGASLGALNLTILGDLYEGTRRATAIGYNGTVLSFGTAIYPALGGALALLGWRYPFALPILALPVAAAVLWVLDERPRGAHRGLGEQLAAVGATVRRPVVFGSYAAILVTFVLLYGGFLTYLPVLLDRRFGSSSLTIGLVVASASATTAVASALLGRLTVRYTAPKLVLAGFALYVATFALIPLMPTVAWLVLPALLYGAGQGINIPSLFNLLTSAASEGERAAVLAVNQAVLRGGQTIGPLLGGLAVALVGLDGLYVAAALTALASFGFLVPLLVWASRAV